MTVVDTLITRYKLDSSDYQRGASNVMNATSAVGTIISGALAALGALGVALVGVGIASSRQAADFESLTKSLEAVEGSAGKAKKSLEALKEIAKNPGIDLEEAVRGYAQLRGAGISGVDALRGVTEAGNVNARGINTPEALNRILLAMTQIAAKDKFSAEELNQISEAGFYGAREVLRQEFGTSDTEKLQAQGVNGRQAIEALIKGMEKLNRAGDSAANTWQNFEATTRLSMVAIGKAVNVALMPALRDFTAGLESLNEGGQLGALAGDVVAGFDDLFDASGDLTKAMDDAAVEARVFVSLLNIASQSVGGFGNVINTLIRGIPVIGPMAAAAQFNAGAIGAMPDIDGLRETFKQEAQTNRNLTRSQRDQRKRDEASAVVDATDKLTKAGDSAPILREIATNTRKAADIIEQAWGGGGISATTLSDVGRRGAGSGIRNAVLNLIDERAMVLFANETSRRR